MRLQSIYWELLHQVGLRSYEVGFHTQLPILSLHHPAWGSTVILSSTTHSVFPQASSPPSAPARHWVDTVTQPQNSHWSMPLYSAKTKMLSLHQRATQALRTGQTLLLQFNFFFPITSIISDIAPPFCINIEADYY